MIETLAQQGQTTQSMAASIANKIYEVRKKVIKDSLKNMDGEEHRLEFVAKVKGIMFINDSKASNVNATWFALSKMSRPIIWIVGGQAKNVDYTPLQGLVETKVKGIVCLGLDNAEIIRNFGGLGKTIIETNSANDAVKTAYRMAEEGDVVLLSPACPSFDLFESYEDRGLQFKTAVNAL